MSQIKNKGVAGSSPAIFVVDDEPMLLNLAEMILRSAGFQVCLFHDLQKVLCKYVTAKPPIKLDNLLAKSYQIHKLVEMIHSLIAS
jgi:DNA-binding NtrC family response regulator